MIAFVHGMAVDMTESSVVVEAGGIGYEIYICLLYTSPSPRDS